MSFAEILGQKQTLEILKKSIKSKKIFHSYIFYGPEGVGKELTAKIFAQAVNCENFLDDVCNNCPSCKRTLSNSHPDIRIIQPEGKTKTIKIEQIREMVRDTAFRPYLGNYKVYIFNDAEKMKVESANTFLKIIEEPPSYVIFILITTYLENLLPTIISRCNLIRFNSLNSKVISDILKEKYDIQEDVTNLISELSYGNLNKALSEREKILDDRNKIIDILALLSNKEYVSVLKITEEIIKFAKSKDETERNAILQILDIILFWFRDILLFKCGISKNLIVNRDILNKIDREAKNYTLSDLQEIIHNIKITKSYISRNVNIASSLNILFLSFYGILNIKLGNE